MATMSDYFDEEFVVNATKSFDERVTLIESDNSKLFWEPELKMLQKIDRELFSNYYELDC